MNDDDDQQLLRYDLWIEDALRQVIRRALSYAIENGLPGEHHFYITFKTAAEDVQFPPYLLAEHPDEMTIVLQHQYESLALSDIGFEVTLRFGGKPEHLKIPFAAVTSFADPSVNFGLQLKAVPIDEDSPEGEVDNHSFAAMREIRNGQDDSPDGAETEPTDGSDEADGGEAKSGEVIALDAFRKK